MADKPVSPYLATADGFDKLAAALIAQAAVLSHFAVQYRAQAEGGAVAAAAEAAPATTKKGGSKAAPTKSGEAQSPGASTGVSLKEAQDFAVAWISEGKSDAEKNAIKSRIVEIVNKYGGQKLADLAIDKLHIAHAEIVAAKAAGTAAASSVIDI